MATPEARIVEELLRIRARDRDGFDRMHRAFQDEYHSRLDRFMKGTLEELPKFQGAALAFQQILGYFNQVMKASQS